MHKLHLCWWDGEEGEGTEDNLNAGCIVLHMLTQENLQNEWERSARGVAFTVVYDQEGRNEVVVNA